MIFVIPYAFSSVIKQLESECLLNEAKEKAKMDLMVQRLQEANAAAAAEAAANNSTLFSTRVFQWFINAWNQKWNYNHELLRYYIIIL